MLLISVGSLFLCLILIFIIKIKRNAKYMVKIPGTHHDPILGIAADFVGNADKILPVLESYVKTYGPLVKVYVAPATRALLATDEKFLEYIFGSNKLIDKAEHYEFLHNWLGMGLITSTGTKWKKHRRIITSSFHFSILDNFINVFENNGDILVHKLEEQIEKASFDVFPLVNLCTLDIICESAMGTSINAQNVETSDYVKSVKIMSRIAMERTIFPIPNWLYLFTPNYYREKRVLKIMHDHSDQVIDRKMKEIKSLSKADNDINLVDDVGKKKKIAFLDLLLLNATSDGMSLSQTEVREEVDTFMFAGHDTVSTAISFAIFAIANNRDVQDKLLEEQKQIFSDIKTAKPEMSHLHDMKYMEMVIKETLRLYPPVCFLGRQLKEDLEWNGHRFPKNMNMILFIYGNFRNSKYFPEPLKFKPERFQNHMGLNPYIYVPFSAGPRNCLGQKFAMLEMKSILSKIIRNYELNPANPIHILKLVPDVVLVSKNGVRISIKKRK